MNVWTRLFYVFYEASDGAEMEPRELAGRARQRGYRITRPPPRPPRRGAAPAIAGAGLRPGGAAAGSAAHGAGLQPGGGDAQFAARLRPGRLCRSPSRT